MIIITGQPGQLGNSLITYATFVAFSIENKTKIVNPSFYRYKSYFTSTDTRNFINKYTFTFLFYFTRLLIKLKFKQTKDLDWKEKVDMDKPHELGNYKKLLFVQGWEYRGREIVLKHEGKIKQMFRPQKMYLEQIDSFFSRNFKNDDLIIGIHIRRGDYKTFENGKYYYSTQQYQQVMEQLVALFQNVRVCFLICSNEQFTPADFGDLHDKITLALNHELLDMYSLARCNYIVGPPSTYSIWASFYGHVPLCMLHDMGKNISMSDFSIQTYF